MSSLCSNFTLAFKKTADKIRAHVTHDSFEGSVIEIKKEDLNRFLETLQYTIREFTQQDDH